MRSAVEMVKEAKNIVIASCGDVVGNIVDVKVNTRARTRWGMCSYNRYTGNYIIELSSRILQDDMPYDAAMSTAVHEVLHACNGALNHGATWQYYAGRVTRNHPELKISRETGAEEFGLQDEQQKFHEKYAIRCESCGNTHYSSRLSKAIKHPEYYQCHYCHGKMVRVK